MLRALWIAEQELYEEGRARSRVGKKTLRRPAKILGFVPWRSIRTFATRDPAQRLPANREAAGRLRAIARSVLAGDAPERESNEGRNFSPARILRPYPRSLISDATQ
jgi:hypothetical protein